MVFAGTRRWTPHELVSIDHKCLCQCAAACVMALFRVFRSRLHRREFLISNTRFFGRYSTQSNRTGYVKCSGRLRNFNLSYVDVTFERRIPAVANFHEACVTNNFGIQTMNTAGILYISESFKFVGEGIPPCFRLSGQIGNFFTSQRSGSVPNDLPYLPHKHLVQSNSGVDACSLTTHRYTA